VEGGERPTEEKKTKTLSSCDGGAEKKEKSSRQMGEGKEKRCQVQGRRNFFGWVWKTNTTDKRGGTKREGYLLLTLRTTGEVKPFSEP